MQQHGGNLLMLHICSINLCQSGRGSDFFEKLFCQKTTFFAIDYRENTTICSLQLKLWVQTIYGLITGTSCLSDL